MKNSFRYIIPAALSLMLLCGRSAAQDLNPTVEVSRQYRGTLMDMAKPSVPMAMPDSLLKFNLEFDYSVFDNPFRGSYEFRPFLMDMDIAPSDPGEKSLYLRAGAGFTLHPTLDFVWSPVRNERFRLSVYAQHRSYIGNYRTLGLVRQETASAIDKTGSGYSGYDMLSAAGVDGAFDWETGVLSFKAGYYGTALKDTTVTRGYNGVDLDFGISSKRYPDSRYVYDVRLGYRYAEDGFRYAGLAKDCLTAHDFDFSASAGGFFRQGHAVMVDMDFDLSSYGAAYGSTAGNISFVPHYLYSGGRWNLDMGVKLAFLFGDNGPGSPAQMNSAKGQVVYPDIEIRYAAIRKHMDIFLNAGGGTDINRYSSLLHRDRHLTPLGNTVAGVPLLDNTVERVSAVLGLEGNIASRLEYCLKAGYRNFGNAPLEIIAAGPDRLYAGLDYSAWQMFFASLDCTWTSQDVDIDCRLQYQTTDVARRNSFLFAPPALSGCVDFMYNWKRRIFAGVGCGFSTSRSGSIMPAGATCPGAVEIPAFADLGVTFEYAFTRKFSLWLHGGNLLDMTIQRTPLYAESGIYFTAGICLNL